MAITGEEALYLSFGQVLASDRNYTSSGTSHRITDIDRTVRLKPNVIKFYLGITNSCTKTPFFSKRSEFYNYRAFGIRLRSGANPERIGERRNIMVRFTGDQLYEVVDVFPR